MQKESSPEGPLEEQLMQEESLEEQPMQEESLEEQTTQEEPLEEQPMQEEMVGEGLMGIAASLEDGNGSSCSAEVPLTEYHVLVSN